MSTLSLELEHIGYTVSPKCLNCTNYHPTGICGEGYCDLHSAITHENMRKYLKVDLPMAHYYCDD